MNKIPKHSESLDPSRSREVSKIYTLYRTLSTVAAVLLVALPAPAAFAAEHPSELPSELRDLKLLASCLTRDPDNRFGPNRTLLAERLRQLNVFLSEDPANPFFDDLSLALLLKHFKLVPPQSPVILAAPQGKWLTIDNPELVSPIPHQELATPLPARLPKNTQTQVLVLGRNAFEGSLKSTTEDLKAAYIKNPQIFANPENQITFNFENSLTQRLDSLVLNDDAYRTSLLKRYGIETAVPQPGTNPEKETIESKLHFGTYGKETYIPIPREELRALTTLLEDLPSPISQRAFRKLTVRRLPNGFKLRDPRAVAEYRPIYDEIVLTDRAFSAGASSGKGTLTHEIGHAVAHFIESRNPELLGAFESISWRKEKPSAPQAYALSRAISPKHFVSSYSKKDPDEDFAETFALFVRDSNEVKQTALPKYEWMKRVLFPDRDYFRIYPKNAQIELSSTCEDGIAPEFSIPLREAIELTCEVDPQNPEMAQIVARITGVTDTGVGIAKHSLALEMNATEGASLTLGEYGGGVQVAPNHPGTLIARSRRFALSEFDPQTLFTLQHLKMSDSAENQLAFTAASPIWDEPRAGFIYPSEFTVTVPGKRTQAPASRELRDVAVQLEADSVWVSLPKGFESSRYFVAEFTQEGRTDLVWNQQITLPEQAAQVQPDPLNPSRIRLKLDRPKRLSNGTYSLSALRVTDTSSRILEKSFAQDPQVTFKIQDGREETGEIQSQPETLSLHEVKSEKNSLGGTTGIEFDLDMNHALPADSNTVITLIAPDAKSILCMSGRTATASTRVRFVCDLPRGHLAGTYSVEEINIRASLGGTALRTTSTVLARQGIRKTLQIKDLMSPQPKSETALKIVENR